MTVKPKMMFALAGAALLIGATATAPTVAQTLTKQSTVVSPQVGGANCTTSVSSPCPNNYQFAPGGNSAVNAVQDNPTTYTFADIFNQAGGTSTFSDFGSQVYSTQNCGTNPNCLANPLLTWNFQDNFDFMTPGNGPKVQGAVLSFSSGNLIGLQNVQARIVAFTPNQSAALSVGTQIAIVDGWQSFKIPVGGPMNLFTATLMQTPLAANKEYELQIRGEAASAGNYTGSVTFTPVPLPRGLALFLSGLLGFGVVLLRAGSSASQRPRSAADAAFALS